MSVRRDADRTVHVLGAGLSGLASAIVLARAGREVHVHELRADSGARFHGDFEGLENWSRETDFFDELRAWGIDPTTFRSTPFDRIDLVPPDGHIRTVRTTRVAFRVVERGTAPHSIDQALKRQALAAGATLNYRTRRDPAGCDIIATGPQHTTGIVRAELFHTRHPNHVTLQLDDRLAPGAYTYLIVVDGVGLVATVILRRQRDPDRFLNEAVAWYADRYPGLEPRPIRRLGGFGGFGLNERYRIAGRLYVGEAAGLQDCLWGFGMRQAITSGVLAAEAILERRDYESAVRAVLRPRQEASLANRWLLNRLGARGQALLARVWLWDQRLRGDGLAFISRIYRPSRLHRLLYRLWAQRMLEDVAEDELGARRMPFEPAARRDGWAPSAAGREVAEQRRRWREAMREGRTD